MSSNYGDEALQRDVEALRSTLMLRGAKIADLVRSIAEVVAESSQEKKQQEYDMRLAQFVAHHFDEMDWQALIACGKGLNPLLHKDCEHRLKLSAERARDDYSEVLYLRGNVRDLKTAIRESKSDVEAKELNEELNETNTLLQDCLTTMATKYNFDGNVALCDQAMSTLVKYEDYPLYLHGAEIPGNVTAFFKKCGAEYNPAETSELLAFFQTKYPDA